MNYALLLSCGRGTRISSEMPKQYVRANGLFMVTYSLMPLFSCEKIDKILIVAEDEFRDDIIDDLKASEDYESKFAGFAQPGRNRQESIRNGLKEILKSVSDTGKTRAEGTERSVSEADTVLVHDAARPFLSEELLNRCYDSIKVHDGVIPVLPMKDTVYVSEDGAVISELIDRSKLYAGQAPELFRLLPYYKANIDLGDEKILEINGSTEPAVLSGMDIAMIKGDEENIKITTDADLKIFIERKTNAKGVGAS